MALSLVKNTQQRQAISAAVRVLLLDTPENLGVDFLQSLQRQEMKLVFERVNDKEGLLTALKQGNWDILLVCDQVHTPTVDETLACLNQLNCETGFVLLSKAALSIEALTQAYQKGIAALVSAQYPEFSLEVFMREAERSRRNFQLSHLNQEKFELKRHCQQLMSGTEEALAYLQDGIHVYGNDAYLNLLGYQNMDELIVMPFIDIVSTEMREKTKQQLLDFQHKIRMRPETTDLDVRELFVNGVGAQEGVLQVAATFKPMVYDGENCIQVVFKLSTGEASREESGAAEGLGYPLFMTHLDHFITQAKAAGKQLGQVAHVRGSGFEHYIAARGFGSLNGKLKALASELKSILGKDDLLIRFTESSFLILNKPSTTKASTQNNLPAAITALLNKFEATLNKEIGSTAQAKALVLASEFIPVDANSVSAEKLIKSFLIQPANTVTQAEAPANAKLSNTVSTGGFHVRQLDRDFQSKVDLTSSKDRQDAGTAVIRKPFMTTLPESITSEPGSAVADGIDQARLNAALNGNTLSLQYETVISVADIETVLHDIGLYLPSGKGSGEELVSRATLGRTLGSSPLALKLDLWALHNTLAVVADLYNQGLELPVLLSLSARSLATKNLAETVRRELHDFSLPGEMLVIDFGIDDINADVASSAAQLAKLKAEGVGLCISDVLHMQNLNEIQKLARVDTIRLQSTLIEQAATTETDCSTLRQSVNKLHELKLKVLASAVNSNKELSACCKASIDLVKGKYIQKTPQAFKASTLAEEMMI